jgi:CxxC-x17-CxxC domain-containing protein
MSFADKTLTCRDCGTQFVFTAGEQEFYAQKGFTNEPGRCLSCRQARKQSGMSRGGGYGDGYSASYAARDDFRRGGGARGFGGEREMHSVTCASCGREARVPFVPRGDKPVYCDECFQQQRRASRW